MYKKLTNLCEKQKENVRIFDICKSYGGIIKSAKRRIFKDNTVQYVINLKNGKTIVKTI